MPRALIPILLCLLLAACAPRAVMVVDAGARGVGTERPIFFATTRSYEAGKGFVAHRSSIISYGKMDVSVPPDRKLGQIAWPRPGGRPDPARQFLTVDSTIYPDEADFRQNLHRALAQAPDSKGEVVVFVHGFNTTFGEAIYRTAQLGHDMQVPSVSVVYSWPSAGKALRYAYDRDSVLFARSGLERTLDEIVDAGASRILLVAHSLGSELVMEVLRQMQLDGNRRVKSRISGVILVSPDIDTQIFRRQAKEAGDLPQPFVIVVSGRDRALALSALLTGRSDRLGNLKDLEKVAELDVTVVDVSAYSVGNGHFTSGNSPALLAMFARFKDVLAPFTIENDTGIHLLPGVAETLENATEIVLAP